MEKTPTGPLPSPAQDSEAKAHSKVYQLTTAFRDLHIGKFLGLSSAVYIAENVVYYPFDVLRTRLQVKRGVSFCSSHELTVISRILSQSQVLSI
jgi:hypothetical protein